MKKQKGITLIALIVTVIVILILVSVSLNIGDNYGIIRNSKKASDEYLETRMEENIREAYLEYVNAKKLININYTLRNALENNEIEVESISGNDKKGYKINVLLSNGTEKLYQIAADESIQSATIIWKQKEDETITDGNKELQIGDLVNYQTELAKESNAVDTTKKAELISDLSAYSGNTHSEYNTDSSVVRNNLTWSVLDVKDGKLRLISTVPTVSAIKLENADGYNNAVYLLDKACDTLYSIDGVGKAQNLKIEDIEDKLVINDGKTIVDNYIDSNVTPNIKYGDKKEYTSNLKYPNIYQSEIGCKAISSANNTSNTLGVSEQRIPITGNSTAKNRLKVTQTAWYKEMESTDFTNSKYFSLFINNGSDLPMYWLASRSVDCYDEHVIFGVRIILGGKVRNLKIFFSNGGHNYVSMGLRPVITLSPDVKIGEKVNGVWQINS